MEWVSGNIFIRPMTLLKAGDKIKGHTHKFDHTAIVFTGALKIKAKLKDGREVEQEFQAPAHALIKAGVEHELTAIDDGTIVWCVYSHRSPQGDVIQQYIGWHPAYG